MELIIGTNKKMLELNNKIPPYWIVFLKIESELVIGTEIKDK